MRKQIPAFLIIFLIIIAVQSWMANAADQFDRVDLPLPVISQPIAQLNGEDVLEWTLNDSGQWESSQVSIPRRWNDGHFKSITLVKVQIQKQNYLGLIFCFTTGDYIYPEIGEGWYSFDYYYLYVFKKNELNKFLYPKEIAKKPKLVTLRILYKSGATEMSSLERNLQQGILKRDLKYGVKDIWNLRLMFNLFPSVDQGIIRFTMAESTLKNFNIFSRLRRITHANIKSNLILDGKIISPATFQQNYYEVDFEKFNQVFGLKKAN